MKTPPLLVLATSLCLTLASCVPVSNSPLSPPDTALQDPALVGDWLNQPDQETYRITSEKGPWLHVDIIDKSGKKTESYRFYPTSIGKTTFANVIDPNKEGATTYTFIRYSIAKDNTLTIWSMSADACAVAIKSHELQGTVSEEKNPDVHLTNSSGDLIKFIQQSDLDRLFTNKAVLTKIPPSPNPLKS